MRLSFAMMVHVNGALKAAPVAAADDEKNYLYILYVCDGENLDWT